MTNIRNIAKDEYEVWTKYESDRVRVRRWNDGKWRLVGSYVGGIYAPSSSNPEVKASVGRDIETTR